ncbi:sodium:proton antiporter, partial [Thermomonas sp.]|uniref:cation:proton antiporter n=1 Tax=Thermomonas sp. TaxID=1971895 RepID=UPI00262E4C3C
MEHNVFQIAAVVLLGITCQWVAWWTKLPAILFLLLTGLVIGPGIGWLDPDAVFGPVLLPIVSLAVAVILFEGALTLRFSDIRGLERVVRRMVSSGLLVTWLILALAAHFLVGFGWEVALLFGALVVVTGPTVIVPMLRTVRPTARIAELLRWEGIVIDPIGALLAVLVFEFIVASGAGQALLHTLATFAKILGTGIVLGALAGWLLGLLLRGHRVPEYLRNVTTLAVVWAAFALANAVESESGLLAVTVMGMWLANMKRVPLDEVIDFKETLTVLLISVLFIVLAARLRFSDLIPLGWGALGVLLVAQFVARPLKILATTWGSSLKWQEKALLAWIAPRGIVAAAVSAIFAPRLEQLGYAQAELLVPMTFVIIIGTVVLQSATAGFLARLLGVAEPEPHGVLVLGGTGVARRLGKALKDAGFRVLLCDTYWDNVRAARMDGLEARFVNPVSEEADRMLDLIGIGQMLALSPRPESNALAALRYRGEFGRQGVYRLASGAKEGKEDADTGRVLFSHEATHASLTASLARSGEIRATRLSEQFDW